MNQLCFDENEVTMETFTENTISTTPSNDLHDDSNQTITHDEELDNNDISEIHSSLAVKHSYFNISLCSTFFLSFVGKCLSEFVLYAVY